MSSFVEKKTYYQILDLQRNATNEQIQIAFKMLATRFHPMRNPTDMMSAASRFAEICEAYDVLSDCKFSNCFYLAQQWKTKRFMMTMGNWCLSLAASHLKAVSLSFLRPFISISVRKMGGKWFVKEPSTILFCLNFSFN